MNIGTFSTFIWKATEAVGKIIQKPETARFKFIYLLLSSL
jgi:hypothetical protein